MMTVLGITVALIVLLITALIVLKKRKKCSSCSPKEAVINKTKASEPVKPQPELKAAEKPIVNAEPAAVNSHAAIVAPPAKPYTQEATAPSPVKSNCCSLPQDSILRRHYFTHLCTMLETLVPPRPTESVLCRHYDTMIVAKIYQCLNDKKAMEQLICDYESLSA